jgi:dGTPase
MPALSRLKFSVQRSRGRRYPEPAHPYRNAFQRDRDRIVHARAFRRLEDKTQVFTPGISDHFRNRLTHTMEVAQIARTAAAALGLNEDLTETLALAHDIGHPPFAHAGEEELDSQMRRYGEGFNHNLHALRIVEWFEQRYARFPGLNLTFEVREGIVKHSMDFAPGEFPELDEYLPGKLPPLEGQLIDLADEIAYNTADLDDAFAAGMFRMDEAAAAVPAYGEILESVDMQFPGSPEKIQFLESLRTLIDHLVSGLIAGTSAAAEVSRVQSVEEVREADSRLVQFSDPARQTSAALKRFLHERVYNSPQLLAGRDRSAALISELFEFFVRHPERLPEPYGSQAGPEPAHRVVCDYIAGMTDGFFLRTARQMLGITLPVLP